MIDTIFCLTQVFENGIDCTVDHMLCTMRNMSNIQTSQVRKSLNVVIFYHIYNLCRQNSHFFYCLTAEYSHVHYINIHHLIWFIYP